LLLNQTKVSEEVEDAKQQPFENAILEVHRQYNLWRKKTEGSSLKKTIETKKIVETKKSSEPSAENIPEESIVEVPTKKNLNILKRSSQIEFSPINPPSTSSQKIVVDKPELTSQGRSPTPFSLEGELAKVKIPIPLSKLMNKDAYHSQVIKALTIEPDIGTKALIVGSTNHSDIVNLTDDKLELLFGVEVDG
jgi:hypothetical protein